MKFLKLFIPKMIYKEKKISRNKKIYFIDLLLHQALILFNYFFSYNFLSNILDRMASQKYQ